MTAALEPVSELKLEGITKRFPGVLACDGISLQVRRGEVLALVGENGAGKTTLMNIIMGLYRPDSGALFVNPDAYSWQLSVGEQQRVELVKTLCLGARLLILDEPTSALTPQETDDLIERLQRMASELAIIFISHKLNEVKALSDRVSILRRGAVVF